MLPKPSRRYTSIPTSIRGRGGKGGRGAGRGSSQEEDERDSMPLIQRKSTLVPQKRKAKPVKEQPAAKKAAVKVAPAATGIPKATSLISGRVVEVGSSSLRPKIYKQLTLPKMLPALESFAKPGKVGYLERSQLKVPEVLKKRWSRSPVKDGEKFEPKLNVLDDESLLLDRPLEGGNLGYRILKAMQLKYDMPMDEV